MCVNDELYLKLNHLAKDVKSIHLNAQKARWFHFSIRWECMHNKTAVRLMLNRMNGNKTYRISTVRKNSSTIRRSARNLSIRCRDAFNRWRQRSHIPYAFGGHTLLSSELSNYSLRKLAFSWCRKHRSRHLVRPASSFSGSSIFRCNFEC